jgi:hypothetical protein
LESSSLGLPVEIMNPPEESALAEKARLQQHYAAAQQQKHSEPPHSPNEAGSAGGSGTNATGEDVNGESGPARDFDYDTEAHRGSTPPPYSGPSSTSQPNLPVRREPKGPQRYPGLPLLDYRLYQPPLFELSTDRTTIKSTAPYLSSNATALVSLIRAQSTVPPKPQIHIIGKRGHNKIDFAIKLNLMNLLVPDDARQRMDYMRCVAEGEVAMRGGLKPATVPNIGDGGLEEWARTFVEDAGGVKSFMLERVVANLDINWLEGQIRSLIASMAYKGVVTVSFPVTHAKVRRKTGRKCEEALLILVPGCCSKPGQGQQVLHERDHHLHG